MLQALIDAASGQWAVVAFDVVGDDIEQAQKHTNAG